MAIRIRKINKHTVALCAAKTEHKDGDIYLDDTIHHALSTKFGIDFYSEGFMSNSCSDPIIERFMNRVYKQKTTKGR